MPQSSLPLFDNIDIHGAQTHKNIDIPASIMAGDKVMLTISQVKNYLDCPLDFYYKHVLNLPQEPGIQQAYGTLMHNILEQLNISLMAGQPLSLQQLQETLQREWPTAGHSSAIQRERALKNAQKTPQRVSKNVLQNTNTPKAVKQKFYL